VIKKKLVYYVNFADAYSNRIKIKTRGKSHYEITHHVLNSV